MPSIQRKHSGWFWFSVIWAAVIFILSVIPVVDLPSLKLWEPDKLAHAIVYAVLTTGVAKTLFISGFTSKKSVVRSSMYCISYSFIIECIQRLLPSRTFDLLDLLANCTGVLLGVCCILFVFRLR